MSTRYLLAAALLVVLTGCQAVQPDGAASAPVVTEVVTEVATEEIGETPASEGATAVTDTTTADTSGAISPTTESGSAEEITSTVEGAPTETEVSDFASLVDALRTAGMTVEEQGEIEQAFFSVPGKQILVNGGNVQVFEYATSEAAAADAGQISPDGSSTSTVMITWVEPPHFYRKDQMLVFYVGNDGALQELLAALLGPQFAGQ